jgi:hypothetical protein
VITSVTIGLLFSLWCCGSPTTPKVPTHPNEIKVLELTKCFAEYVKMPFITAEITEQKRMVPCTPDTVERCPAKGWAMLPGHHIVYWGPFVRGEYRPLKPWDLQSLAAHEVAHVELLTWNEIAAEYRGVILMRDAGCE